MMLKFIQKKMIERTAKIRLKKIVQIANLIHYNPDDAELESKKKELQESLRLIQHLDHIVLTRSSFLTDNTKKKKQPRERRALSPKQLSFLRNTFSYDFFLNNWNSDSEHIMSLEEDLRRYGLSLDSIIGEQDGTNKDSLIWYDASLSDVTSSGSE